MFIKCPCCGAQVQVEITTTQVFTPAHNPPPPKAKPKKHHGPRIDTFSSPPIRGKGYVESFEDPTWPPWEDPP